MPGVKVLLAVGTAIDFAAGAHWRGSYTHPRFLLTPLHRQFW
jgi:hypothetical protein